MVRRIGVRRVRQIPPPDRRPERQFRDRAAAFGCQPKCVEGPRETVVARVVPEEPAVERVAVVVLGGLAFRETVVERLASVGETNDRRERETADR